MSIDHLEHGLSHFLLPLPLARFPLLYPNLKLPVEALNGHERVLYEGLHGNPEMTLLLAKFKGRSFQDFWKLRQDIQRKILGDSYMRKSRSSSGWWLEKKDFTFSQEKSHPSISFGSGSWSASSK
jgi:hypothetical protein